MSTALQVQNQALSKDQIDLIKSTVAKGATDDELKLFLYQAQRTGLDPLLKQIHAVKRWNAKSSREEMAIQTGIDGFRLIADRSGLYAGNDDPVFDNEEAPKKATVTVYKMIAGQRCGFSATARWDQYYPGDKQGFMWKKMPHLMLGKCAESLALRKAFPAELSGVYTHEEMEQAGEHQATPVTSVVQTPIPPKTVPAPVSYEPVLDAEYTSNPAGEYVVKFGKKYQGKQLKHIPRQDIQGFLDWLNNSAASAGKPLSGPAAEFVEMANKYLNPGPLQEDDLPF
jgi:phage recombination protein Bet